MNNQLLANLFLLQLSQTLPGRERDFKLTYSAIVERCHKQTAKSHACRNRFKLGHHLIFGRKFHYEDHRQEPSKNQKFQYRRL